MNQNSDIAIADGLWENSKAKIVYDKLRNTPECQEACRFYERKGLDLPKDVLQQGSADFDKKHDVDDSAEKPTYRVQAYIWQYMDMHLKQNLALLHHHKSEIFTATRTVLFVDFGCGPMTAGVVLRDIANMAQSNADITYLGIDASDNMLAQAKAINEEHGLFAPERFFLRQAKTISSERPQKKWDTIILHLSFVLAPDTYQAQPNQPAAAQALARDWKDWVQNAQARNMMLFYLNPDAEHFHANWIRIREILATTHTPPGYINLLPPDAERKIRWQEDRESCYSGFIRWRR